MAPHPNVDSKYAMAKMVKAINDTLGPKGVVPSVFVFEKLSHIETGSEPAFKRSFLVSRAKIATAARTEMQKYI